MQSAIYRPMLSLAHNPTIIRSFSTAPSILGAGDTGSPKPRGFLAEKDPFTRREAASEAMYIREHEREKLELLRKKLKEQKRHTEELDKYLEELLAGQGGEKN
ncbi:hypothetical protein N7493_010123 [Penicillium malachiteum]|uniref:ATPase inhibitor, mitochondrial n=1 Tax=Penicillium malachiteum TaxID=1324776 RepID=A0AAD6MRA1_9EURO|nr:hypothetical protein N7493_010123 [Penicillium malachiteum]